MCWNTSSYLGSTTYMRPGKYSLAIASSHYWLHLLKIYIIFLSLSRAASITPLASVLVFVGNSKHQASSLQKISSALELLSCTAHLSMSKTIVSKAYCWNLMDSSTRHLLLCHVVLVKVQLQSISLMFYMMPLTTLLTSPGNLVFKISACQWWKGGSCC